MHHSRLSRPLAAVATLGLLAFGSDVLANTVTQNVSWTINRADSSTRYRVVAYGDSIWVLTSTDLRLIRRFPPSVIKTLPTPDLRAPDAPSRHLDVAPDGSVIGSVALKVYSLELAELGALAVHPDWQARGVGRALCDTVIAEARGLGLTEVFALTRKPLFFTRIGFEPAEREHFPLKVWADWDRCPRKDACDEIAIVLRL